MGDSVGWSAALRGTRMKIYKMPPALRYRANKVIFITLLLFNIGAFI